MDWLILSLTAAALWGGASVVDKVIVEKHLPSPVLCAFFMGAYGLVSALVVGLAMPLHFNSLGATSLACLSGILYLTYILLYFAALRHGDTAVVVALGQITPLFTTYWDYLIFGQVFWPMTYVGVIVLVLGAGLISLEHRQAVVKASPRFTKALQLMVVACFVRSLSDLTLKYTLTELSGWDGFFWPRLGIFAGAVVVVLVGPGPGRLVTTIKGMGWPANLLIMGNEVISLGATLANTLAYTRGPLTLVAATGSVQPLLILLLVTAANIVRRGLVPEQANWRLGALRLPSVCLIISGAYLLGRG
jgi:bacterial/archaeal transporter family protein